MKERHLEVQTFLSAKPGYQKESLDKTNLIRDGASQKGKIQPNNAGKLNIKLKTS